MRRRRGIFLVSILFFALVIAMFVTSALQLTPASLTRGRQLAQRQAAERAIRSGLEYAVARIRATPGGMWLAQTPRVVQLNGLTVREGDGQVEGWIRDGARWSRFRFSFNHQDGPGGMDRLDDTPQPLADLPGICCNNLPFNVEYPVPRPGPNGMSSTRFQLPPHCAFLSIEGGSGSAAGTQPVGFSGTPSLVRAELVLQVSSQDLQLFDSVASSTGDLNFVVQAGQRVTFQAAGSGSARLRTKNGISVLDSSNAGGELYSGQGELRTANNGQRIGATVVAGNVGRQQENQADKFYSIPLDAAPQAGAGAVELKGGVYEVDLINGQPQVKYYELSYADYKAQRLAGTLTGGELVQLDSSIKLNVLPRKGRDMVEVHFTKDATVKPGAVDGLAMVPAMGAFQEGEVPVKTPGGGGVQTLPAGNGPVLLAVLAQKIQSEFSSVPTLVSGPAQTNNQFSGLQPVSDGFAGVLSAYSAGGSQLQFDNGPYVTFGNNGLTVETVSGYDSSWDGLSNYGFQMASMRMAQHLWTNMIGDPTKLQALEAYMGGQLPPDFGAGAPPDVGFDGQELPAAKDVLSETGPLEPGGEPPNNSTGSNGGALGGLAVKDFKIRLEKAASENSSVTLRGPGEVVLAGMLEGRGGAVVARGNLSLLGNGVDLEASQDAGNSINLYSGGDILVDGFAFDESSSAYNNISLKGVMYSWGQIRVNAGKVGSSIPWGGFDLKGAMVAFGADPGDASATAAPKRIDVTARDVKLVFDPAYLLNLNASPVNANSAFVVRAYHQH